MMTSELSNSQNAAQGKRQAFKLSLDGVLAAADRVLLPGALEPAPVANDASPPAQDLPEQKPSVPDPRTPDTRLQSVAEASRASIARNPWAAVGVSAAAGLLAGVAIRLLAAQRAK